MSLQPVFRKLSILFVALLIWSNSFGQCVPPSVTTDPSNTTACAGTNPSFTVAATGTNINYQWQINTGSGFVDISNNSVYSGATSATLSITGATTSLSGYTYRCVVRGDCTPNATSTAATLTVNASPAVTANPSNSTICAGANTTFSVTASGTGVSYQWQVNTGSGYSNISNTGVYSGATSATLTVTGATTSMSGYLYRCVASIGSCSAESSAGTLTVNGLPAITTHPSNSTVCSGSNTTLSVAATGAGLTYQWQINTGSGFSNLSNGGIYSGATSANLTLTAATASVNNNQYRCIVSGTCTPSVTSNAASITINSLPAISANPTNKTICEGTNTTFTVTASGTDLDYQWQINTGSGFTDLSSNAPYSGATSATLTISNAQLSQNGYSYRCMVRGACTPAATSASASLTVNAVPAISSHPNNQAICTGDNTSFSITASGSGLSYQWQVDNGSGFTNLANGGVYSGVAASTLNISSATASISGYNYRCVVSNANCSVQSNSASLSVGASPSITTQASNRTICDGTNTTFIVNASNATGYQWQEDAGSGFTNISNGGVFSGATTATLSITGATATMTGRQYRCVVSNNCTSTNSSAASLTVHTTPSITSQPGVSTICSGNNTTFAVTASGTGLSYQWQVNTGLGFADVANGGIYSSATTATLAITAATNTMIGYQYRCNVTNVCATLTSDAATLTVNTTAAVTSSPSNRTICEGTNTTFSVGASGTNIAYQWQVNTGSGFSAITNGGVYSGATTSILTLTGATATLSGSQYRCVVSNNCTSTNSSAASLTVHTTPSITSQPVNSLSCSGGNASFTVTVAGTNLSYQWQVNTGLGFIDIANTGVYSGATAATLSIMGATTTMTGYQYRCNVTNVCATLTSNTANLTVNTTAAVTSNPSNRTICAGTTTTFVAAGSGTNITYQWQVDNGSGYAPISNGGVYSGATSSILTITGATTTLTGNKYRCVVSNNCATANSTDGLLTVHTTASVTGQPSNSAICSGGNTSFGITSTGTGVTYQWSVNTGSGFTLISNNTTYSGATTSTLSITGATAAMNGNLYRCDVTNVCGTVTSSNAILTINSAPTVTTHPANTTGCDNGNSSFTVGATGTGLTYQWEVNNGSGFTAVTNGGIYSGATSATLSLTGLTTANSGSIYRCVVSGSCTPSVTSNSATLTVNPIAAITSSPNNSTICRNQSTTFTVAATGVGLSYQWQVNSGSGFTNLSNSTPYSNVTAATLSITSAPSTINGYVYRCVVSSACGGAQNSNSAVLTVNAPPAQATAPSAVTVCEGSNTSFTVVASGAGVTYQWQVRPGTIGAYANISNTGVYSGANTATLELTGVTAAMDNYSYRCVMSGTCSPSATSTARTLTVNVTPSITSQPSNASLCAYSATGFSIAATGTGNTYRWQFNTGSGTWTNITAAGTNGYSGFTTTALTIATPTPGISNYQFRCVVTNACTVLNSNAATLNLTSTPTITSQPPNRILCTGAGTTFTTVATGATTYQWQEDNGTGFTNLSNTGIYSGVSTNTLNISAVAIGMTGYKYRCIIGNGTCAANTNAGTLTITTTPAITVQPVDREICQGNNTTFAVTATGASLSYRWQVRAGTGSWTTLSNGAPYTGATTAIMTITNPAVSLSGNQYRCFIFNACGTADTSDAKTLTINANPIITTQPSNFNACVGSGTSVAVVATGASTYKWQVDIGPGGFTDVVDNSTYSGSATATLNIANVTSTMNSYQYRCIIDAAICPVISSTATMTVNTPATITADPVSQLTLCQGANTSFSVTATGTPPSYQWQVDDGTGFANVSNVGIYSGANSSTLSLTNVPTSISGYQYRCVVNNFCTSQNSAAATIGVQISPAFTTHPSNTSICDNDSGSISVVATGSNLTYQWQVDEGSGFSNVSGTIYGGATTATLDITGATTAMNGYQYRCVINNNCATINSNAATLSIHTPAAITAHPAAQSVCEGSTTTYSVTATGTAVAYQWQVDNGTGFANISNTAPYTGATTATLSISNAPASLSGYQYRCVVSNPCTTLNSTAAGITVHTNATVNTQPANTAVCSGDNASFSIATSGTGLTYQWQVNTGSGFSNVSGTIYGGATTATLDITGATTAMNGYQYRCVINNNCATINSNAATLSIHTPAAITAHPAAQSVCEGSTTTYSVTATGTAVAYQWQVDNGTGFANISNTAPYTGATTATLSISNAPASLSGYQYRCVVSNPCTTLNSTAAGITVHTNATVNTQPANTAVCSGDNASFSIATSGTGLTYQWQVNTGSGFSNVSGTIYGGATTATLDITGATTAMNGYQYRCVINNNCATINSNAATLTVHTSLAVTTAPTPQSICEGGTTAFSIANSGTGGTYQWQVNTGSGFTNIANTAPYTGASTANLAISNASASLTGNQYRCVITNACGSVTSTAVTLTVQSLPSITTQPANSSICDGANTAFAVSTAGTGITYQWQVNTGSGFTSITNNATYSGANSASLAVNSPIASMDGYRYRCIVTNVCYSVTSNAATLTVNTPPAITTNPASLTTCETYNTTISVVATGSGLTYQWQVNSGSGFVNLSNSGIYTGATTANLILTNIPANINGYQYRCVIAGTCTPSVTSSEATVTVNNLPAVTSHPTTHTLCSGANTSFSVNATGTNINYQWEINTGGGWVDLQNVAPYSNVTTATLNISNVTTSLSGYQYRCMVRGTCTPGAASNAATLTVNPMPVVLSQPVNKTICDGTNTSFTVSTSGAINYQWQVNTGSGYTNISNGGIYSGVNTSTLTLTGTPQTAAGQYRCVIDNVNCATQTNGANLIVNPLPTITSHPSNRAVCAGDATTISIVAPGGLTYIWQVNTGSGFATISNGGIYSGATTANLTISNVSAAMSGYQYRCTIDNTVCSAQSNVATVSVNSVPIVTTQPANKTICLGTATSYSVAATGTGISYQWEVNNGSGWVDLQNNVVYSNVTTATLNITGALAMMNGYQYRCVVRGTCTPPAISNAATLTINMPPVVTAQPQVKTICEGNSTTFSVTATGTALTYKWQVNNGTTGFVDLANNTNYSGVTTTTLSVLNAPASYDGNRYRCVVTGTCSPIATSDSATLTVNTSPAIQTQPTAMTTCKGQNAFFTLAATGTAITYQWQVNTGSGFTSLSDNAIYSGTTTGTLMLTKVPLSYNSYQYRCVVTGVCPPPATSAAVALTVHDSTYLVKQSNSDTVCEGTTHTFSVTSGGYPATTFKWQVNTGSGFADINDNTVYSGTNTNTLSIANTPDFEDGNIFRCILTGYCNQVISQGMKLDVNMIPTITAEPVDALVKDNENATFSVTSKDDNVKYRWQSAANETDYVYINDNQNYSGTRTNVLTINKSSIAQSAYRFRCIIEEITDCGFKPDTSNFAVLAVRSTTAVRDLTNEDYQVMLYPNPVKASQVFVRFSKAPATQLSIRIVDKLGRTVAEEKATIDGSGELSVNVNNLVPGVYMLMLGDEQSKTAKTLRFTKE